MGIEYVEARAFSEARERSMLICHGNLRFFQKFSRRENIAGHIAAQYLLNQSHLGNFSLWFWKTNPILVKFPFRVSLLKST